MDFPSQPTWIQIHKTSLKTTIILASAWSIPEMPPELSGTANKVTINVLELPTKEAGMEQIWAKGAAGDFPGSAACSS